MNLKLIRTLASLMLALCAGAATSAAQSRVSDNILRLDDPANAPAASIGDVAWIAGHWAGQSFGGAVEEVWSRPAGGAMMGMFQSVRGDSVYFYEFMSISEENGSLLMRIKHFNSDLRGWEPQDESVEFPLVELEPDAAYFDGLTVRRIDDNHIVFYVLIGDEHGDAREIEFRYARMR